MSERIDVDRVLRSWLSDGVERAPDHHVLAAIERSGRTAQLSPTWWPGALSREPRAQSVLRMAFIGAAAAVLLVALSVVIGSRVGIDPPPIDPVPGPSSSPSAPGASAQPTDQAVTGSVSFTAPDGSFQIDLPAGWQLAEGPDLTALYLVHEDLELSIRAGDADGGLVTCDASAGPWETCERVRATTLDELGEAVGLTQRDEAGVSNPPPQRSVMTLGGEPAGVTKLHAYEHPAHGTEFVGYVAVVHEARPYLIRIWTPLPFLYPLDDLRELLAGFRFATGDAPPPSPRIAQPESVDGFQTFVAPDESFEIRLPESWAATSGPDASALYVTDGRAKLSARGGDPNGRIRGCDRPRTDLGELCPVIQATTLESLADAVGLGSGTSEESTTLGGEAATSISTDGPDEFIGAQFVTYLVAMHEGRPFLLRIWTGSESGTDPILPIVLDGFSFKD